MRITCAIVLMIAAVPAVGAEPKEELKFEGKPLAEWVRALKAPDLATRYRALEAVYRLGGPDTKEAFAAVREAVKDPVHRVRYGAVFVLGRFGAGAVPAILEALPREDLDRAARDALRAMGPAAVAPLQHALADSEAGRRAAAALALGWLGANARGAVPELTKALEHSDGLVRVQAAAALRAIEPANAASLPALLEGLRHADEAVRRQAADLLGASGARDAVPALREALNDKSVRVRVSAAAALTRLDRGRGKELVPVLLEGLKGEGPRTFRTAAQALAVVGPAAKDAKPALIEALRNPDPLVTRFAAFALPPIGRDDPAVFAALVGALKHPEVEARLVACSALGQMAAKDSTALPALETALKDRGDPAIRSTAAAVLATFGPAARPALPALTAALKDSDGRVRLAAAGALLRLGARDTAVVPALAELLQHGDDGLGQRATIDIRRQARVVLPLLAGALKDKDAGARAGAARVYGALGPVARSAAPDLSAMLKDDAVAVRLEAAIALCQMRVVNAAVIGPLLDGLKAPEPEVRRRAAEGLVAAGPGAKDAVPALVDLLKVRERTASRVAAARALAAVGAEAKAAAPALTAALKDDSPLVRLYAADALLKLGAGTEPVPVLIALLKDKAVATRAQTILQKAGPPALPALLQALQDPDAHTRQGAAGALGHLEGVEKGAVAPALTGALKDGAAAVRLEAADALLRLDKDSADGLRQALPVWAAALQDESLGVRQQALGALSQYQLRTNGRDSVSLFPLILTALRDANSSVRQQATMLLPSVGSEDPKILALLLEALKAPDHPGRAEVILALRPFGAKAREATPALVALAKGKVERERLAAVQILGEVARGDAAAVAALAEIFQGQKNTPALRREAAAALGAMGGEARKAVPALTVGLQDADAGVRRATVTALARIGAGPEEYLPTLAELIGRSETPTDSAPPLARETLRGKEKDLAPVFAKLLRDANPERRLGAALGLLVLETPAADAAPALGEALKDADARVRVRAAEALWRASKKPEPGLSVILDGFKDADAKNRRRAAAALVESLRPRDARGRPLPPGPVSPELRKAVPVLVAALKDADDQVPWRAATALGALGAEAKDAVPALVPLVKPPTGNVLRQAAIKALGGIGPDAKAAIPDLMALLQDSNPLLLPLTAEALGRIGANPKDVAPVLVRALQSGGRVGTLPILSALQKLGPGVVPDVVQLLKATSPALRGQAAQLLGQFGAKAKAAVPALRDNLKDEQPRVAVSAAVALWQIEATADGLPVLIRGLSAQEQPVRLQAALGLGLMGPKAKGAVPALQAAAKAKDPQLQRAALQALAKIDPTATPPGGP